jgi:hypothetical protein
MAEVSPMSLLREIQDAAVDNAIPIGTLLRKCAVLAARVGNEELRQWTSCELNGYLNDAKLPDYRMVVAPAVGNLAGPFNSGWKGISIPPFLLPESARDYARLVYLRQPVSELEALAAVDETRGELTCPWPATLLAHMQTDEAQAKLNGHVLYAAWQTLSRARVLGIVDTIRNKVLEFSLRLEKEAPSAGESNGTDGEVSNAVSHLYQTVIYGNVVGNVATGGTISQSATSVVVPQGNTEELRRILTEWGVPEADITELEVALTDDPPAKSLGEKPKTAAWLSKVFLKTISGSLQLAGGVSVNLIAQIIGQFLGLPTIPPLY